MNILMVATESWPYSKTGSLADVVYGLSRELCLQGHDVRVVLPCYRGALDPARMKRLELSLVIPLATYSRQATFWRADREPIAYLLEHDFYFGRSDRYGYLDDYERFIFLMRGALELIRSASFQESERELESPDRGWFPHIIQGFDWAAGLVPHFMHCYREGGQGFDRDSRFDACRFVLYVHNVGKLGTFSARAARLAGLEEDGFFPELGETLERLNFLGRGVALADRVVTVNPQYGPGNPLPAASASLKPLFDTLRAQGRAHRIPSGIDYEVFNPETDISIVRRFSERTLRERVENKRALQRDLEFEVAPDVPLLGMVTRLKPSKGVELLPEFLRRLSHRNVQFVVLAEPGVSECTRTLGDLRAAWNQGKARPSMADRYSFDERLAKRIYAGCDALLLPSRDENSNIQQYIAMRFGAIPVVHCVGALRDSVTPFINPADVRSSSASGVGFGFTFEEFTADAFYQAVEQTLEVYQHQKPTWLELQRHNMRQDFSWYPSARQYEEVYRLACSTSAVVPQSGRPIERDRGAQLTQALLEIDSLPGLAEREKNEILRQVSRLARELVSADAICVWSMDVEKPIQSRDLASPSVVPVAVSLDRNNPAVLTDEELMVTFTKLTISGSGRFWLQFSYQDAGDVCRPIEIPEGSEAARQRGWIEGLSVLITAHSRILGRIDAMFTHPLRDDWTANALTTVANSIGFHLETFRMASTTDEVLDMSIELLGAHSLSEVVACSLRWARRLSGAKAAWLYLGNAETLQAFEGERESEQGIEVARDAVRTGKVVYVPDMAARLFLSSTSLPYRSMMAIPLIAGESSRIGALLVASAAPGDFDHAHERALRKHVAPEAASAIETALWHEKRSQGRVEQIRTLTTSLSGGRPFEEQVQRAVQTTANVLGAGVASLYLLDDSTGELVIQAATGYQEPLVKARASYRLGEGITGHIAQSGKAVIFQSTEELCAHPSWRGKHNGPLGGHLPRSFVGVPLTALDPLSNAEKVIGVLKAEDIGASSTHPSESLTEEDIQLVSTMAGIISTVVYNAKIGLRRTEELSRSLKILSGALAGGKEMDALVNSVVQTIAQVVNAGASSVYLIDEITNRLVIRAATGYQEALVKAQAQYAIGEGITGIIAQTGKLVRANSLDELHRIPGWAGKQNHLQDKREPDSFLGLPLEVHDRFTGASRVIGVLKVEDVGRSPSHPEAGFSDQDVLLITMMANVIATVVYNTQVSNIQLADLSSSLRQLSEALAGGKEMATLVKDVVRTMAATLNASAASLYLLDDTGQLVIRAATGYQESLVQTGALYMLGEGITGTIAETGKPIRANSLQELRSTKGWKGKQNLSQGGREPSSFLGLPLKVQDRRTSQEKVIGVLKVEDVQPSKNHPDSRFSYQDVLLVTMMANVIAAVVYNTQVTQTQLDELSNGIKALSGALAGGQEMSGLVANVVNTMAAVLNARASSLYLIDEATGRLVIQAAAGYQEPLLKAQASYSLGEDITGTIASTGSVFRANTLEEFRKLPGWKGKMNPQQKDREPRSFLGVPLLARDRTTNQDRAIGVLKVEDLQATPKHLDERFTDQDVLLVQMMANVVAAVISNTRWGESRLGQVIRRLGLLSAPQQVSPSLLTDFARSEENGTRDQLAITLASALDANPERTQAEARALLLGGARARLFQRIADWSRKPQVKWQFAIMACLLKAHDAPTSWEVLSERMEPWLQLRQEGDDLPGFRNAVQVAIQVTARALALETSPRGQESSSPWHGALIETQELFGDPIKELPLLFHLRGALTEETVSGLLAFAATHIPTNNPVLAVVVWDPNLTTDVMKALKRTVRQQSRDLVVAELGQILQIVGAANPREEFRRLILRQVRLTPPFVVIGAVPNAMFVGRASELQELVTFANVRDYAIVGNRRIGKTSFLRLARSRLQAVGTSGRVHAILVDCQYVTNARAFFDRFRRDSQYPSEIVDLAAFEQAMRDLARQGPVPVLLLDEVDALLNDDYRQGQPLVLRWRHLASAGVCHFVLCGSGRLGQLKRDPGSALFNFTQRMVLGYLDHEAAKQVLLHPLELLELHIEDRDVLVKRVLALTSGHPNLVQYLGKGLLEAMNKRTGGEAQRFIEMTDLATVENSDDFARHFKETTWGQAGALERLITLLTSSGGIEVSDLEGMLARHGLNVPSTRLDTALNTLCDYSIFEKHDKMYLFIPIKFREILERTEDVSRLIRLHAEEARNEKEMAGS